MADEFASTYRRAAVASWTHTGVQTVRHTHFVTATESLSAGAVEYEVEVQKRSVSAFCTVGNRITEERERESGVRKKKPRGDRWMETQHDWGSQSKLIVKRCRIELRYRRFKVLANCPNAHQTHAKLKSEEH